MFVELTQEEYERLKNYLMDKAIAFEASDCTIEGEKVRHVHVELPELSTEQINGINQVLTMYKQQLLKDTGAVEEKTMDTDGDGRADYLEELDAEEAQEATTQPHKLKKRDVTYNPVTLAKDYFFGDDEKEIE